MEAPMQKKMGRRRTEIRRRPIFSTRRLAGALADFDRLRWSRFQFNPRSPASVPGRSGFQQLRRLARRGP